jgi:HEPN domain-containing protein
MSEEKRTEVWKWLVKSRHDVGSACLCVARRQARRLMEGDEPYLDTAVYHCQQTVEKALKAFLTYHDIVFEKTHDLTELVALSAQTESAFDDWQDVAAELTPYAVRFRYPADVLEPPKDEAEEALQQAESFVDFVLQLLPEEVQP